MVRHTVVVLVGVADTAGFGGRDSLDKEEDG
jgi:hypothetical protein